MDQSNSAIEMVDPDEIIVGERRRGLNRDTVDDLKVSIARIGLKTPISVREHGGRPILIAGLHRLQACIELGMQVFIRREEGSEADAQLWEIAENLHRAELTRLERDEHIVEWIRLSKERQSSQIETNESKRADGKGHRPEGGVNAAARELRVERNEAHRAVNRMQNIPPQVRDEIRTMPEIADTAAELDALSKAAPEQQAEAIKSVKEGKAKNAREALSPTPPTSQPNPPHKPKKPPKWSRDQWIYDTATAYRVPRAELYANLSDNCRLAADAKHCHEIPLHRREWLVERLAAALGVSLTCLIEHAAGTALTIRPTAEKTHTTDNGGTSTERIAKLFAMLSSPNDAEVVAAARALKPALAEAGTSFVDIAQQLMEQKEPSPFDIFNTTTSPGARMSSEERLQAELQVPFSEWASHDRADLETAIAKLEEELGCIRNDPDAYARKETENEWEWQQQHEQRRAEGKEYEREVRRLGRLQRQLDGRRDEYRNSPEYAALTSLREKKSQLELEIDDTAEHARQAYAEAGTIAAA